LDENSRSTTKEVGAPSKNCPPKRMEETNDRRIINKDLHKFYFCTFR
jgi:hypothetical protein